MTADRRHRVIAAVGWLFATMPASCLVLRQLGTLGPRTTMWVALLPLVGMAAWPAVLIAWRLRRPVLLLVATSLTIVHAMMYVAVVPVDPSMQADPSVRVYSANVRNGNEQVGAIARSALEVGADIIVLQEVSLAELRLLRATPLPETHPHMVSDPRPGYFGGAVFSRWPIEGRPRDIAGYPMLEVVVGTPEGPIRLIDVHVDAPLTATHHDRWQRQLETLGDLLEEHRDEAVILVGDFNATPDHAEFRALADHGAHARSTTGTVFAGTYPAHTLLPPILRLDHAVVSPRVALTGFATTDAPGSDHRAIIVDLEMRRSPVGEAP